MSGFGKLYLREANKTIEEIHGSLSLLEKSHRGKKAIMRLCRQIHNLEGISLQEDRYFIAYLAAKMQSISTKVLHQGLRMDKKTLVFLFDFSGSIAKTLRRNQNTQRIDVLLEKIEKRR